MSTLNARNTATLGIIKATAGQIEGWDETHTRFETRRQAVTTGLPGGRSNAESIARFRARGTTSPTPDSGPDAHCIFCELAGHLTVTCPVGDTRGAREATVENPSTGIHRALIHRLYTEAGNLYRALYPRFYPGPEPQGPSPEPILSVQLTGPDYFDLSIIQAVEDFAGCQGIQPSDLRNYRSNCTPIVSLYYSKTFPVTFQDYCLLIADRLEEETRSDEAISGVSRGGGFGRGAEVKKFSVVLIVKGRSVCLSDIGDGSKFVCELDVPWPPTGKPKSLTLATKGRS